MVKKIFKVLLTSMLMISLLAGCNTSSDSKTGDSLYTPGTYSSTAPGNGGDVTVTITVDENSITDIVAAGEHETPGIGTGALEDMPKRILDAQSVEVDVITYATVTSNAVKKAAADCLAQASGTAEESKEEKIYEADVLVLGAGGAGLSAALSAANEGASVIVLEADGVVGGATNRSAGHITVITDKLLNNTPRNDADLSVYLDMNEEDFPEEYRSLLETLKTQINEYLATTDERKFDSYERIMVDHYLRGYGKDLDGVEAVMDFDLISTALSQVNETWNWIVDETEMPDAEKYQDTFRVRPKGEGVGLTTALCDAAEEAGAVIYTNTRAIKLITDDNGKVCGVIAQNAEGKEETYQAAKGVIIATGGFQSNSEMANTYQNQWVGVSRNSASTSPKTEQGDGIIMAQELGADLVNMQFVTTWVVGYGGTTLISEAISLAPGSQLLVNSNAVRYCNDTSNIKTASNQPDGIIYLIGDSKFYDYLGEEEVLDYASRGILFTADTLEEAAKAAGLDSDTLSNTVNTFNGYVDAGEDPDFGRTSFNGKVEEGPYVIIKMEAAFHLSLGGLLTNTDACVLHEDGSIIEGLYAAGDVTGGMEGAFHQSADHMSTVIYYGKVAGKNAASAK